MREEKIADNNKKRRKKRRTKPVRLAIVPSPAV